MWGISSPALAAVTSAATTGRSQTAVIFSMRWFWRVNIRNGTSTPQATAMIMSSHQRSWAINSAVFPQRGMPKATKPLMIVARPIGIAPKNIETVECPRIRRAWSKNRIQRAA